ncbi:SAM-dependent methyltransferase MidA [Synechococcus sp. WH 8101]|nr:SAM-dependent methyltransferase [Synechococcus sp. WH 8101]QBE69119.1 SAM-dependent methyltransferase MidA [Synechococcus sp. WH 8101]QNI45351.1 protein arginine methyltransferase/ NDUFAF7 superfamily [Synechococcus sp. WH 8101]
MIAALAANGGSIPFRQFMKLALHHPEHGAYGSGRLLVGPRGDFATSPSLGPDFAALLAPQIAQWLQQQPVDQPLALVEAGPGEGDFAWDLAQELAVGWPELAARTTLLLLEPNAGMAERQRLRLRQCPLPCQWLSVEELAAQPVRGVVLAHEVLDALAVERIVWDGALWRRQQVALQQVPGAEPSLRLEPGEPLEPVELAQLEPLGLLPPGPQRDPGWCTELHPEQGPWLRAAAAALESGVLLVIDYALEAWRYYAPQRSSGTLMAYRQQRASPDPLQEPGCWDLTAHLCLETLEQAALAAGWQLLGQRRQGEALLALGLAQRLHGLQQQSGVSLEALLARREALLRLVDPHTLGDFRWIAFSRSLEGANSDASALFFLQEPPLV